MNARLVSVLVLALEFGLALVFLWAGALKALDPGAFARDIGNYRLLPALPSALLALYLPWLEIAAGAVLVLRQLRRGALALLCALSLTFTGALALAWVRGLDITCGCFGGASSGMGVALVRAALLAILAGWLLHRACRDE